MWYHSFQMSCGCMYKIWQDWDPINTLRSCLSKPQTTQTDCLTIFGKNCKIMTISSGWYILFCEEPHAMDALQPISSILWMHVQSLTSMWPNQYTGILSIRATKHPIWGTRSGEHTRATMLSSCWCMLSYKGKQAMDELPSIPHFLQMNVEYLISLGSNEYTGILLN